MSERSRPDRTLFFLGLVQAFLGEGSVQAGDSRCTALHPEINQNLDHLGPHCSWCAQFAAVLGMLLAAA